MLVDDCGWFSGASGLLAKIKQWCSTPDPEHELEQGLVELYLLAPGLQDTVLKVASHGLQVKYQLASLGNTALATTEVLAGKGATITVDISKVHRVHDHIIPVLAHELWHVHQAFEVYGVGRFCEIVEMDAHLTWEDRRLEMEAVAFENSIRSEMLKQDKWRGKVFPTRQMAQRVASNLGLIR